MISHVKLVMIVLIYILSGVWNVIADTKLEHCDGTCSSLNFPAKITSKHYYLNIATKVNWFKAHQFCIMHGMRLATILNEEQNKEMLALMAANGVADVWFGLTDLGDEGKFYNMANGKYVQNFTYWLPGQPDNHSFKDGPEHCGRFWRPSDTLIGWNDDVCEDSYYFACDL